MNLKFALSVILPLVYLTSQGQNTDSIEVKANYGSAISDVQLLMDIEKIDYFKVSFKYSNDDTAYFILTTKEYWNGKVTKSDTVLPIKYAKEYFRLNKNDTSTVFTLITKPLNNTILFNYKLSGISLTETYKRIKNDDYSLRDGVMTNEEFKKSL